MFKHVAGFVSKDNTTLNLIPVNFFRRPFRRQAIKYSFLLTNPLELQIITEILKYYACTIKSTFFLERTFVESESLKKDHLGCSDICVGV